MKLACEHPRLIFNPNLVWLFSCKCQVACYDGNTVDYSQNSKTVFGKCYKRYHYYNFPWRDFYAWKEKVTEDNIDNFYLIDDDGVTYPIFMYVPCGKCRLCRDKQCDDWETRCVCESAFSPFPPLFITLTYKPGCRPDNMEECYEDFVLFMKRLRTYVERRTGVKRELRYLAASEWTPKSHYAHIHMILWNMPFISPKEGDKDSFWALINFVQEECWQNGICRVERCRDVSGAYCLKYIRKGVDPDCWKHSSRRNGIGYDFAMKLLPTILKNPDMMTFSVTDGNGRVQTKAIPAYFKRLWFPTLSVLFPAEVSKAAKDFHLAATELRFAMDQIYWHPCRQPDIIAMVSDVWDKYEIMHIDFDCALPSRQFRRRVREYIAQEDVSHGRPTQVFYDEWETTYTPDPHFDGAARYEFRRYLISLWTSMKANYKILMKYQYDVNEFRRRLAITMQHQDFVRAFVDQIPDRDVDALVVLHEQNRNWVETHWMQNDLT